MWYVILSLFILLLLFLRMKFFINIQVSDQDEAEYVVLIFSIFNIAVKKVTYSREEIWNAIGNFFKKKEQESDNYFLFILRSLRDAHLKIEEVDCLLNFTTDEQDIYSILLGISNIVNGIAESYRQNKKSNVQIRLTVNESRSHIKCILSSKVGKIITLIIKYVKEKKKEKRSEEYVPTSY